MAGNFTPSQLLNIQLKAEQMWNDGAFNNDLRPQTEAGQAVLNNQTASFSDLEDPAKDRSVIVTWIKTCDIAVEDCESNCDLEGDEADTTSKEYVLDTCFKTDFSVNEEKLRKNTYDLQEVSARQLASALRRMDEKWSQLCIAKMHAFEGVNIAPDPYTWDSTDAYTSVDSADYDRKIVPYFIRTALLNRMRDYYLIDNGKFYLDWLNVQFDTGNLDGKGDAARIAALNMYFDLFNFIPAGVPEDTFLIDKSAMAMVTRARHSKVPQLVGGKVQQTWYAIDSPTLPGVVYDVFYQVSCVTINGKANIVDTWRIETNGGIFLNPEQCPVEVDGDMFSPTGILGFKSV